MNQANSTIRIAHVATVYQSLAILLHDQMAASRRAGYKVTGISSPPAPADTQNLAAEHFYPVPMQRSIAPFADLVSLWRLFRLFRRERFDVVHTHTPKAGLLGRLAARAAGVPIVCHTVHGFHFHSLMPRWLQRFYILIERIASRCCDRVLSQNREDLETAVRERIVPAGRIGLLGNGIDVGKFDRTTLDAAAIACKRAELGLGEGVPVVGFVGRLAARRKGFADFMAAAKRVAEVVPDVRFLIVGQPDEGKPDAVSANLAAEFGIAGRCLFLGHRPLDELPLLYAQMDLVALPSLFEGLPRAILEGAAMGVPAVASDVKGNREAVRHGETGFLVPHADVDALTRSMVNLLQNPGIAASMGAAARRFAEDRFDERKVIGRLLEEYSRLLRNRRTELQAAAKESHMPPKRSFDFCLALLGLALLLPVFGLVAIGIAITMGRPLLFRQRRPGRHGKIFNIAKFRTMTAERDPEGNLLPDADRLTRLGKFLRVTSLDELPQLWHVLTGEMSLVGPRPLLPQYLDRYSPEQQRRHEVRPGITGLAQVKGRAGLAWDERFELDTWYVHNWSFWLDVKIILLTAWAVIRRDGISQGGQAAMTEFMGSHRSEAL